ncbi:TadE/TadG family type IV pilus assembly protein [Arsenicitalea aurantiaca]|nr:TadE/TadG family type IV pilus assembly protein [Arsenicitalea aurantiaca]
MISRRRFLRDEAGVSAIEFALIAPVLCLIFVATLDLGGALYTRFELNEAVSASAAYALVQGESVTATDVGDYATAVAAVAANSRGTGWANVTVTVNNGATRTVAGGNPAASGSTATADNCYCPRADGTINWTSTVACATQCTGTNLVSGKFVEIEARRSYQPIFAGYGIVDGGEIPVSAVVQVQ